MFALALMQQGGRREERTKIAIQITPFHKKSIKKVQDEGRRRRRGRPAAKRHRVHHLHSECAFFFFFFFKSAERKEKRTEDDGFFLLSTNFSRRFRVYARLGYTLRSNRKEKEEE